MFDMIQRILQKPQTFELYTTSKIERYILGLSLIVVLFGCNNNGFPKKYGSPISNRETIPIADLFENATKYDGKTVTIKGVIDMQDKSGHWFYMQDEEARIYVEPYNVEFSIPDLTGKTVLAEGSIEVKLNIPSLLATGVEHQR
jgi:hypothetical protein